MPLPPLPDDDDHLRSMTVVPYLEDLHHCHSSDNLQEYSDPFDGHFSPGVLLFVGMLGGGGGGGGVGGAEGG